MWPSAEDLRYHNYYRDVPAENYNWSTDYAKFPGIPTIFPGEAFVLANGHELIRQSNTKWHYSIFTSLTYVAVIFTIQRLMAAREKGFELRIPLITWNWLLAAFSLAGTIRCLPEFIHVLANQGFVASYTQNSYVEDIRVNAWYLFFTFSKAPELVDTLFIVFRKRRLIHLHWIHHTLTLIYSWFVFGDMPGTARWMVNMNLVIHTAMYAYYALAAMRIRLPRQVNITITTLQIAQMFAGLWVNMHCLYLKLTSQPCDASLAVALSGFSLYGLFFILFCNFFFRTYILPTSTKATKVVVKAVANGKTILADFNNNASSEKNGVTSCGEMVKKLQ